MKKFYLSVLAILIGSITYGQDLLISGVFDGPLSGGSPKVIELYVINNIADLSIYGVGSANNGGGSDGEEFTFPADSATEGDFIYVAYEANAGDFLAYFGFDPNYTDSSAPNVNGDDAIELFMNANVIDTFGDINTDGTGTPWEYLDGWTYRVDNTGPDGAAFVLANWTFSGINANDGETSNDTAATPFPIGTFSYVPTSDPSLNISYPTEGLVLNPEMTAIDVSFVVQNFVVANGTGDGYIQYGVDGSGPDNHYSTDPISLTGLSSGSHTLFMQLVDNSGNPLSPAVDDTVNFDIAAYTDVANLGELRAGTVGEYYRVTGEVYGTFGQAYRNQKWCQDATGGIMIDDNDGIITTLYNEGDGVVNLRGKLNFYQVLQLIPTADPGVNSTGNIITPEVITLADLASAKTLADYESELVQINGVSISDYDDGGAGTADGTFQTGQNFPIDDGTATSSLRTNFYDTDYIGTALPTVPMTYVCIVGAHNDIAQVTPRSLDDILSINNLPQIAGFELYPNPVTDGVIHINTANNEAKDISIYNLVGKLVYQKNTSAFSISIDQLDAGIYMIQVVEAGHVATRKLLVK